MFLPINIGLKDILSCLRGIPWFIVAVEMQLWWSVLVVCMIWRVDQVVLVGEIMLFMVVY